MKIFLFSALLFPTSLFAQSFWFFRTKDKTVSLEILKPNFEERIAFLGDQNYSFFTSTLYLSMRLPLTPKLLLMTELPFAHGNVKSCYPYSQGIYCYEESDNTIGNPYLGLEIPSGNDFFWGEVGLRIPFTGENDYLAQFVGVYSDLDRMEAFASDIFSLSGMVNFSQKNPSNMMFRFRGGPIYWINTDAGPSEDVIEFFFGYNAQVGYESNELSVLGGFTGRMLVTEDDLDLDERTFHQIGFVADMNIGNLRPGAHIRFPLDEDLEYILDSVFGLHLTIYFHS